MPRLVASVVRRLHTFAFAFLVGAVVTACAPDGLTRETGVDGRAGLQASNIGDADLVALVEADLTCLYSEAGLLPNESSSLGKFRTVVSSVLAGDLAGAQDDAAKLISFIELKYSQYDNKTGSVDCDGDGFAEVGITELKERTVARINAYVTLGGNVCEIPGGATGSPATFCRTADNQTAIVYFPPAIFQQLTYVSVEENPPGFTRLQDLGFDEYPTYVRIVTEGISDFRGFDPKPLVYVCFTSAEQQELFDRDRLRLGHRHTADNGTVTFKLLPKPDISAYNEGLINVEDSVANFCGGSTTAGANALAPFEGTNLLARIGNRVANFLAPAPLQASLLLAGRGGIGGSAEEFSEFGAVDRGFAGTGGVGGSAEEFSRAEGLASATVSDDGTIVTGKAGVDINVTDPAELPTVRVISPGTANPVAGVTVYFELEPTLQDQYKPESETSFCNGFAKDTAVTDANGQASPSCLNFGNKIGFKKLRVTFDPTTVDTAVAEACMIDGDGYCDAAAYLNFLIATVAGDPAKLAVINTPGATSAQAGVAMVDQPILQVLDAGDNPVTNLAADLTVNVSVKKATGDTGGFVSAFTSTTDKALGRVSLSGLALGGIVNTTYRLTFTSGTLTGDTADVMVTAPGAASSFTVSPTKTTVEAGALISPITATVIDTYGNAVPGIAVTVAAKDLKCFGDTLSVACKTATTGPAGTASFDSLSIRGPGTSVTLTFTGPGGTKTLVLTLTPGAPSKIVANNSFPLLYNVGASLAPAVTVTDSFGNAASNASVLWQLQGTAVTPTSATNGATVSSASTSTASNGTTSVSWTLGDGDNGLRAYLGSTSAFAQFTAATATGGVSLSCVAGNRTRKIDLGSYGTYDFINGPDVNGYRGTFSMQPELAARFRSLTLSMSVTGQSSGTGNYKASVKVYRGSKSPANLIATGVPTNPNGIQLDGNNGSFAPVDFTLTPVPTSSVAQAINNNFVLIEVTVEAPSTRTLQVWYNQPAGGGTCGSTILYAPGVTTFPAPSRDGTPGILIHVRN